MPYVEDKRGAGEFDTSEPCKTPIHPGCAILRRALRQNIVSFPSQIPVFLKDPPGDMQWRVVLLYFVRDWSSMEIARRFAVPKHRIPQVLNRWSVRALALGYVQVIDPDAFATCCRAVDELGRDRRADRLTPALLEPEQRSQPGLDADHEELVPYAVA